MKDEIARVLGILGISAYAKATADKLGKAREPKRMGEMRGARETEG